MIEMLILFLIRCGLIVFCLTHKHILIALLSLEFIVIILYLTLFTILIIFGNDFYFILLFLVFSVCEGALGLSILVRLVRSEGNDYVSSLSCLSW